MIAFGSSIIDPEAYLRYARTGIELCAEHDSKVLAFEAVGAISRGHNLLLDTAARHDDLEALVLVQQDAQITDQDLCAKVRAALADPEVAAVGCAGATDVQSIAWWEGAISAGQVSQRYQAHGGGAMPAFSWRSVGHAPAEVDTLDGLLLVLSPWAVHNVRFDEALALGHGYDLDYCLQLRQAGRKVATADIAVTRHGPLELLDDRDLWIEAHIHAARKWQGHDPGLPEGAGTWKQRARLAEAEREAARTTAYSAQSRVDAQVAPLRRELEALEASPSWRLTRPLRLFNKWRRQRRRAATSPEPAATPPSR